MKLALHRSITFWSGLLVISFVCGAWWDSSSSNSVAAYGHCAAEQCSGGLRLSYDRKLHNDWISNRDEGPATVIMEGRRIALRYWIKEMPTPVTCPKPLWEIGDRVAVFLPFWFILLAVAAPWIGLLFWRAGRRAAASPQNSQMAV